MIDEKLQQQLRAKYNPDGSQLRQHQLRTLEVLKVILIIGCRVAHCWEQLGMVVLSLGMTMLT